MPTKWVSISLILAVLTSFETARAVESSPSNQVGFWKLDVHQGFTQISFPLLPADKSVNNVLAGQLTGGPTSNQSDQVFRWNPATAQFQMCWRNSSTGNWQGDFTLFAEKESYWIYVQPDHPATQTLITKGNVVEADSFNMGFMQPGYNAVGSIWATPAAVSGAGLTNFLGGSFLFQSDLLTSYNAVTGGYAYAWKNSGGAWQGNLTLLEPLRGYWIYVPPGHTGFNWVNYPHPSLASDHLPQPPGQGLGSTPDIVLPAAPVPPPPDHSATPVIPQGGAQ